MQVVGKPAAGLGWEEGIVVFLLSDYYTIHREDHAYLLSSNPGSQQFSIDRGTVTKGERNEVQ